MRKAWLIFGAVQATGVAGVLVAGFLQDGIILGLYSLLLLPGSLLLIVGSPLVSPNLQLPVWVVYSAGVAINALLFAGIAGVVAKRRRPRASRS